MIDFCGAEGMNSEWCDYSNSVGALSFGITVLSEREICVVVLYEDSFGFKLGFVFLW